MNNNVNLYYKILILMCIVMNAFCLNPFSKSTNDDSSFYLSLIGYRIIAAQQGPCGKYVTASSNPQNLNFVSYTTDGINYVGSIVYLENVKNNNQLYLCSISDTSFFRTANYVTRYDNICAFRAFNTPKAKGVLGDPAQVGNCLSYPILKEGSYSLDIFVVGGMYPDDSKVYLQ
ncbi:hypothetical protein [Leptospira noguchii]|uniref:Uncharacterized protein n=1 Tax=Leptospira noguchii str. 2001034031 TaxID=1193053 RepID=M6YAR9_9LEPT|nr:hypothetical protein [Leptospira noguchii]EMO90855.1 hypothetical protein LEP1GSC024_0087 [Leptospira noguchii str. 2001034031]